jgi:hypothetical protein
MMLFNIMPPLSVLLFLPLYFYSKDRKYIYLATLLLVVMIFSIRPMFTTVGGDIGKYYTYFYDIKFEHIILDQWLNSSVMLVIRHSFGEFVYYHIFSIVMFVLGLIFFTRSFLKDFSRVGVLLFLISPFVHNLVTTHIVFSLAFSIVMIALNFLNKNNLIFISLILIASSIHWTMLVFLPVIFFGYKAFWIAIVAMPLAFANFEQQMLMLFQTISELTNFSLSLWLKEDIDRGISRLHIYLYIFFATITSAHYLYLRHKSLYINNSSIVLLQLILYFLSICLVFIDNSTVIVRLGFFIMFFSLAYILSTVIINFSKYKEFIAILIAIIFLLASTTYSSERYVPYLNFLVS